MIRIESYSFGRIKIEGDIYKKDLIISEGKITSPWWRKEGHNLQWEDLEEKIAGESEVLVVGTGAFGGMKEQQALREQIENSGLSLHVAKTEEAVNIFNDLSEQGKNVTGVFHLTC